FSTIFPVLGMIHQGSRFVLYSALLLLTYRPTQPKIQCKGPPYRYFLRPLSKPLPFAQNLDGYRGHAGWVLLIANTCHWRYRDGGASYAYGKFCSPQGVERFEGILATVRH